MKKILLGIVVVLLLAAGGGAWWLYSERDTLIADAIRTYGPQILGVSVKLGGVKTDVANQTAALHGLVIGNPPGFATPHALSLGAVSLKLDIASLARDVILIREISIVKPDITYEHKPGGSNLDVIQRNAEKFVADKTATLGGGKDTKKEGPGKKLIIEHVYVKDAKAEVSTDILKGKAVSVSVPDIHLTDIGKKSNGATAGEATRQIISAITASVTRASSSILSGSLDEVKKKGAGTLKGLFK
jgi:uncharacterized protein involved in outer membrane biogenesis